MVLILRALVVSSRLRIRDPRSCGSSLVCGLPEPGELITFDYLTLSHIISHYLTDFFDFTTLLCLYCPSLFGIFCSEEGDKLTFDLGPDVPGIVLDAEDRES